MIRKERELTKPATVKADVTVAHNYSSQSLNSTEIAKEKLRQMLAQVNIVIYRFGAKLVLSYNT